MSSAGASEFTPVVSSVHMSSLAQKIAKPRSVGNMVQDMKGKNEYQVLVDCVNYLVHYPALRSECSAYLREAYAAGQKQPGGTTSDYLDEVTTLATLDETFAANWIHETNWLCHGVAWQGQESRQPSNQDHRGVSFLCMGKSALQ